MVNPKKRDLKAIKTDKITVGTRVPIKIKEKIMSLVKEGSYKHEADFIWQAIKLLLKEEEEKKEYDIRKLKI